MAKKRSAGDEVFVVKQRAKVPHEFVLDALAPLDPVTRPMFGCTAVYVGEQIVVILRDKPGPAADNGVWLATTEEHHASLRREFPGMQSISVLGSGVTGWQVLLSSDPDFEEAALRACELIRRGDPRIGKVPGQRKARAKAPAKKSAKSAAKKPVKSTAKKAAKKTAEGR